MENKVSDNVIEKNYRECLKFNEINESKVDNFDLVRCADLVTLAEENKDSLFYDAWRVWFRYFVSMGYAGWNELWEAV